MLPDNWKLEKISDTDFPIGNDVIPFLFDSNTHITRYNFFKSWSFESIITKFKLNYNYDSFNDALSFIFKPATEYDAQSYNYKVSRQQIGILIRNHVFDIVKSIKVNKIHIIGPEMESYFHILDLYKNGYELNIYTLNSSSTSFKYDLSYKKAINYSTFIDYLKYIQNIFYKTFINYVKLFMRYPSNIYIVNYQYAFWIKKFSDLEINVIFVDCEFEDYTHMKSPVVFEENSFIFSYGKDILCNNSYKVLIKEYHLNDNIIKFHGNIVYIPKSFPYKVYAYYYTDEDYSEIETKEFEKLSLLVSSNNISNVMYGGDVFKTTSNISHDDFIIALYSISNSINSTDLINNISKFNHIMTFPTIYKNEDWRNLSASNNIFDGVVSQQQFKDHAVNMKNYALYNGCEILSESVFLQSSKFRAFIPDLYNHMVSFRYPQRLFYSDRYYPHIGIRQPSIYNRDTYLTSRISAYISRQLTHSVDMSGLEKDHFAGYSGHLIAIEQFFNSLCYTMSPYRWIVRAKYNIGKKIRDKFRIGKGDPHTLEEFLNTYQYLLENNLISDSNFYEYISSVNK
uniref:VP3 n=1 Tax=Crocidura shantungensis seadorna-like virus 2 TaxID=3139546 RepID=A0AB38ZK36_9REOV